MRLCPLQAFAHPPVGWWVSVSLRRFERGGALLVVGANSRAHATAAIPACGAPQFAKGARGDHFTAHTNSRTLRRRTHREASSRSRAGRSPYHSGGSSSPIAKSALSLSFSMRASHGSKECQPVTSAYTTLRLYTPRSGESGKFHSPALKQKPWSTMYAFRERPGSVRQKISWRLSQLQVHLSKASMPAKARVLLTVASAGSGSQS